MLTPEVECAHVEADGKIETSSDFRSVSFRFAFAHRTCMIDGYLHCQELICTAPFEMSL
jgi:hypothetical protein